MKTHFQWDQSIFTQIHAFDRLFLFKIPKMDFSAVFEMPHFFQIKTRHKGIGRAPFRADHHVVARLIPKIIAEFDIAHRVFPASNDFEVFVKV